MAGEEEGPIRAEILPVDYENLAWYARAWPDKLVSFVCCHLADDGMEEFARAFQDWACRADGDGPDFRRWRET